MHKKKIVRNAIRCKHCLDLIESIDTHEYKYCSCKKVAVDGGLDYLKRLGEQEDYEELSEVKEIPG